MGPGGYDLRAGRDLSLQWTKLPCRVALCLFIVPWAGLWARLDWAVGDFAFTAPKNKEETSCRQLGQTYYESKS